LFCGELAGGEEDGARRCAAAAAAAATDREADFTEAAARLAPRFGTACSFTSACITKSSSPGRAMVSGGFVPTGAFGPEAAAPVPGASGKLVPSSVSKEGASEFSQKAL